MKVAFILELDASVLVVALAIELVVLELLVELLVVLRLPELFFLLRTGGPRIGIIFSVRSSYS